MKSKLEKLGSVSHKEIIEKEYGKEGSAKRDQFQEELGNLLLGEFLKNLRKSMNLSQAEVAELMNTDNTYVSKIENNKKLNRIDTIKKYCAALEAELSLKVCLPGGHCQELVLA
ncbi:MAG: helix-turn-helix domain-containing protein [Salibacteraceae bacterium]